MLVFRGMGQFCKKKKEKNQLNTLGFSCISYAHTFSGLFLLSRIKLNFGAAGVADYYIIPNNDN